MKTASAAKVASQFQDYLAASQQQPVVVTRNGKPVAVLIGVQDAGEVEDVVGRRKSLKSVFQEAHQQLERGEGIPSAEFWDEVQRSRTTKSPRRRKTAPAKRAGTVSK